MATRSRPASVTILLSALALSGPLTCTRESAAGVAPPEPNVVKEFDPDDGSSIFRMRFPKGPYKGPLARCKTCGKPLADHSDPNFVCRAPGGKVKEPDVRLARCPVCAQEFEAPVPDPDPGGDVDRDFCRHPRGQLSRVTNVWMCPKCGYATFHREFSRPVTDDVKAFVRETITPGTRAKLSERVGIRLGAFGAENFSFLEQTAIPEFLKYENAWAIHVRRGAPHRELGRVYLGASHAYRRLMNEPIVAGVLDRSIRKVERLMADPLGAAAQDPVELARAGARILARADSPGAVESERLTNRDRLFLYVRMAGLHDRLGEVWWAPWKYLEDAGKLAAREPDEAVRPRLQDLVHRRAEHLKREAYHQALAAEHFKRALAGGEIAGRRDRLLAFHLVGELLARTGQIAKAVPWFEATVALAEDAARSAPGEDAQASTLSGWATDRLESAASREENRRVAADAEEKAFVDDLLARARGRMSADGPGAAAPPGEGERKPASVAKDTRDDAAVPDAAGGRKAAPADARPDGGRGSASADARPGGGRGSEPPDGRPNGAPASCREQLTSIWKAIEAYRRLRGEFPPDLNTLVGAGLITREAAGGFVCVESGSPLFYRRPQPGAAGTFIIFHKNPTTCPCRNVLYSDGVVRELSR